MVWSNYMQSLEQFKKLKFPCKTPFVSCLHMPNLSPQADPFFTFCTQFCLKVAVFTKEGMGNRQKKPLYVYCFISRLLREIWSDGSSHT